MGVDMTFDDILAKYRIASFSERDKGTRFERLMRAYLLTDPKYTVILKQVWLWEDFFAREELGGVDTGIDLVAETVDGNYWAVQCKCYREATTIDKPDVDTFFSTSGKTFRNPDDIQVGFVMRLWISTTDRWTTNAENALHGQTIPVTRINIGDLRNAPIDWDKLENGIHGEAARTARHTPKPHQMKAIDDTHEYFRHAERGKLIMACGTGKTFTALKITEREANGFALVLVPSIALVGQVLNEWTTHAEKPINSICVCSDPKVSQTRRKSGADQDRFSIVDLTIPATTDPKRIVEQFNKFQNGNLTVIFSTYQSIEAIEEAQEQGLPDFGIIVCDEAHRTTGVTLSGGDESAFVRVHDNRNVKGMKRLYMTATPRLYHDDAKAKAKQNDAILCSMDDPEIYGEEIYRIGFGEAVEKGLLSDYKVLVFTVSDKDIPAAFQEIIADDTTKELPADAGAKIIGCINALSKQVWGSGSDTLTEADPAPMQRAVAFCQSIDNSKAITRMFNLLTERYIDAIPEEQRGNIVGIEAQHIDGTMNAPKREELLGWLKAENKEPSACKILSNVRCLSEGVDVPALDAVMFLSARNSQVDVVQSVGRVMRRSEGKKYGYIIIPVLIPSTVEADKALDDNERYKVVWTVLNALRAHDDRFNATVNKIELNKKRPNNVIIGGVAPRYDNDGTDSRAEEIYEQLKLDLENFEQLQNVIYARLVKKVGSRPYWEDWAKSVAQIAEQQIESITEIVASGETKEAFYSFLAEMKASIDTSITAERAIEMLAQHSITAPVFDALFENYEFAKRNTISIAMDLLLEQLRSVGGLENRLDELQKFYKSVRERADETRGIDNAEGRQRVIIELYNNFFKAAFPKMTEQLGIVYTPVEVVDFIIHSVSDVLQAEFGHKLTDENVNIFDPFTGTGTFITRLIQSGLINSADLPRKYQKELFANELVLLAYYIACVNIENAYHDALEREDYEPFEGIALTDTFQAWEDNSQEVSLLDENSARVRRQNAAPITVIFGNPPYSVGQKSANDNAQNRAYPRLDEAIAGSYAALSGAVNKNSLYDSYIRAFRFATDRLRDGDGIICFVSNGTWLDGNSTAGFRKTIINEFAKIYVFNLRGNQRTSGELSRKEGGKIFGSGSRTPVLITLLVKRAGYSGEAEILYRDIGDYLSQSDKLAILRERRSFLNPDMVLVHLEPNKHGDWITSRNDAFQAFIPLVSEKKFDIKAQSVFVVNSRGFETARDAWVYNFSRKVVLDNMRDMVEFYNFQIGETEPDFDSTKISWSSSLLSHWERKNPAEFDEAKITMGLYRPFTKQHLYFGDKMIHRRGQFGQLFPNDCIDNLVIAVSGLGGTKGNSTFISDSITDLNCLDAGTQCFPLYYYEQQAGSGKKKDMIGQMQFGGDEIQAELVRKGGVSDFILREARTRYGAAIKKEDIFYYVYGFLHSPKYRTAFADDLKKALPRIPLAEKSDDFWAFSKAGRELARLHLEYESVAPLEGVTVSGDRSNCHVTKMRFKAKGEKDTIIFNQHIMVSNIPAKAYEYIVNGKPAIEWVMERYQVKTDKDSGIVNDPNLYAEETGQPDYILDLLLSVISVSVQTMDIVEMLPDVAW